MSANPRLRSSLNRGVFLTGAARRKAAVIAIAVALGLPTAALAQNQPAPSPDDQIDVRDWIKSLRKKGTATQPAQEDARKTRILLVPILGSKPSTGLTLGAGASFEFPLGDPQSTYVSSALTSATVSTKKQYSVSARLTLFGADNRWALSGDHHYQLKGQETYGFGTDAPAADRVDVRYHSTKLLDTYYREITHSVYAGAGFQYFRQADVRPTDEFAAGFEQSSYVRYSTHYGFDLAGQTSAGLNLSLRHDTRDSVSDPDQGRFAEATYRTNFAGFLGGDSTWQELYLDLRMYGWLKKRPSHKLAFWFYGDFVTGGTAPYLALPATGTDTMARSGRGYAEGRFRGDRLLYSEIEYRASLRRDGLVGMVGFLNATTVGSTFEGERLFGSVAVGAGFGLRLRLDKRSRTNLCLDFGWGKDGSRGVYVALAEAF